MIPVHDNGMRASGLWVEFEGRLYPTVRLGAEFSLSWFGDDPPDENWQLVEYPSRPSERTEYERIVSAKDVTRYVNLSTHASWEGRRFTVTGFRAHGCVVLFAYVPDDVASALVAGEHSWEMLDRGFVSGRVPVSELTDVVESMEELPLPKV